MTAATPQRRVTEALLERNRVSRLFFDSEAERLARTCLEMASRFSRGGRLLACGLAAGVTDAQHVVVEFVHPVIVGKRALPAIDVSERYGRSIVTLGRPQDILIAFDPSGADGNLESAVRAARGRGVQTLALAGPSGDYAIAVVDDDPFIHQEIVEILYHVLWETVHVFLEHTPAAEDAGPAGFLYPFLAPADLGPGRLIEEVAQSMRSKARDDEALRTEVAEHQAEAIVGAVDAIRDRLSRGGRLLMLGNGGSATDATDWALDCLDSPKGYRSIPALTLAGDAAAFSALANDVGQDTTFARLIMAHAESADVTVAITTSGGSANVLAALREARRRGLLTIALTGSGGGQIVRERLADISIVVGSDYIPRIQEVHASIYHVMTDLIAEGAGT